MPKPDVRVRLSAEGVAEVVSALKKIQAEGQKTSTRTQRGFGGLNSILASTRNLLGGLGIVLGIHQFRSFISNSIEAADGLNKLSAKVGATTEHLSALQLVARMADSDLNQIGTALVRMNKNIGDAKAGIPTAIAMFRDLDIDLDQFKGRDSVEIFELIAKRIEELPDSVRKGRSAIQVFGRAGAMLLPTMKALADEGLAAVIERADELGVLIDQDLAAAAEQIKDDVELLKMQGESLGTRFVAGFGPQISQALQTVSGDMRQTTDVWQEAGEGIGRVMKWVVGIISAGGDLISFVMGGIAVSITSMVKTVGMALSGDLGGAKREMATFTRWMDREFNAIRERMRARFELVLSTPPKPGGTETNLPEETGADPEELAELADRRARAMQTALDRELALVKTMTGLKTEAEKREFEEGLQSVRQYYADRRALLDKAYAEQQRVLEQKRALLPDIVDPGMRLQEEEKIKAEGAKAAAEYENDVAELLFEERDAVRDLTQERVGLEQTLLKMQGKRIEAERLGFEEQIRQADLLLRKLEVSDEEREAYLNSLRGGLEAGADFDEAKERASAALDELRAARSEIQAEANAGLISQLEYETQILEIEKGRIGTLQSLAAALLAAAQATADPEKIAEAESFAASVREIAAAVEVSESAFTQFRTTALDSATSAMATFLDTGVGGSKSLKESFGDMAASIIGDLKRLAAQMLSSGIMGWFTGLFSGGGQVDADFIGPPQAKAGGGLIRGAGTGTSDSILARLSDEEYIVRAAVVRQPGVLEHLESLNRHGVRALVSTPVLASTDFRGFSEGGLVDAGAPRTGSSESLNGLLTLGLEDGLVLREMQSSEAQRIQIKNLRRNKRAARAALGI